MAYPVQVDATATTVLTTLIREISLAAGESSTVDFRYRDPSNQATRVSGLEMVTPVVNTDYKFSSVSGSGTDLNASLIVTVTFGANTARVTFTNSAAVTGYLWFFQLRGKGVYLYDPVTKIAETAGATSGDVLRLDMYYQGDQNVAEDLAEVLLGWYGATETEVRAVEFVANTDQTMLNMAIEVQVGDAVTVQETQSGISSAYFVNQKEWIFNQEAHQFICRWTLVRVPPGAQETYFTLDSASFGVLDTDMLGY